jgi:hypothetical protein
MHYNSINLLLLEIASLYGSIQGMQYIKKFTTRQNINNFTVLYIAEHIPALQVGYIRTKTAICFIIN